jgi:glucose/mannose-6-phosphate isomerase
MSTAPPTAPLRASVKPIGAARVQAVDRAGMLDAILEQPAQLADALRRARSLTIPGSYLRGGILVCGMGGSAIGGDLAAALLGDRATAPIRVRRDYDIEPWIQSRTLVVCSSYSGNTEETLGCFAAAGARGLPRVAVTSGGALRRRARAEGVPFIDLPPGLQPRAAVAYMLVAVLVCAARCGIAPDLTDDIHRASIWLAQLSEAWSDGAEHDSAPKRLATRLHRTLPVVYGAGPTVPVALRWKTQLNENAEVPAFQGALPEADHNEICAWPTSAAVARLSLVFLEHPDQHPRARRRIELSAAEASAAGLVVERVEPLGQTAVERLTSLVLLGDLVSLYAAVLRGVDPTPVEAIERVKRALG